MDGLINKRFIEWIEKNMLVIATILITILAIIVRYIGRDSMLGDYIGFLQPWYNTLKESGGIRGLRSTIGDYMDGYMLFMAILTYIPINPLYGIKIFSIIFDFIIAIMSAVITLNILKEDKSKKLYATIVYSIQLFLPTVILNGSYWGQCDAVYTGIILIVLFMLIKKKYRVALFLFGIGMSFKLHTILFLPLLVVVYIRTKEFNILEFLNILLGYFIMSIPALLVGKPIKDVLKLLVSYGTGATSVLTANFNNFYSLIWIDNEYIATYMRRLGILTTIALIGICMLIFIYKRIEINGDNLVGLALFFILLITYFLPGMHERYLFPGDVLSILYFIIKKDRTKWYIPLGVNVASAISYLRYVTGIEEPRQGFLWFNGSISIIYLFMLVYILMDIYKELVRSKIIIQTESTEY